MSAWSSSRRKMPATEATPTTMAMTPYAVSHPLSEMIQPTAGAPRRNPPAHVVSNAASHRARDSYGTRSERYAWPDTSNTALPRPMSTNPTSTPP
jgi:hypothetical protein